MDRLDPSKPIVGVTIPLRSPRRGDGENDAAARTREFSTMWSSLSRWRAPSAWIRCRTASAFYSMARSRSALEARSCAAVDTVSNR